MTLKLYPFTTQHTNLFTYQFPLYEYTDNYILIMERDIND